MSIPRDLRFTKKNPCPACGHGGSWCFMHSDKKGFWCGRAQTYAGREGRKWKDGWIHSFAEGAAVASPIQSVGKSPAPPRRHRNFAKYAARWQLATSAAQLSGLASQLHVSLSSLRLLGVGWASAAALKVLDTACRHAGCWSFPMRNGRGDVVGIRLRSPDGFKYAVDSSDGSGLFIPDGLPIGCDLLAVEGPTSLAAALTLGFAAIGRPNCRAGTDYLREFIKRVKPARLVIVGDNDKPDSHGRRAGQESAPIVAEQLLGACPVVRSALPPAQFKDLRFWLQRGATAADITQQFHIEPAMAGRIAI